MTKTADSLDEGAFEATSASAGARAMNGGAGQGIRDSTVGELISLPHGRPWWLSRRRAALARASRIRRGSDEPDAADWAPPRWLCLAGARLIAPGAGRRQL